MDEILSYGNHTFTISYDDCTISNSAGLTIVEGPLVRISPDELHINDPDFIKELYGGHSSKRDRYKFSARQFGLVSPQLARTYLTTVQGSRGERFGASEYDGLSPSSDQAQSVSGTLGHDLHRLRRNALSSFFSKASITRLEPLIVRNVQLLCSQIEQYESSSRPVPLSMAFSCLSTDIAAEYAFSTSYNFLQVPDFQTPFYRAFAFAFRAAAFVKHLPWVVPLMEKFAGSVCPFLQQKLN